MYKSELETLGPYACVLNLMLNFGFECDKKRDDKLIRGEDGDIYHENKLFKAGYNGPFGWYS